MDVDWYPSGELSGREKKECLRRCAHYLWELNPHVTKQEVLTEAAELKPRALVGRPRQASLKVIERALTKANAGVPFIPTGSGTKVRPSKKTPRMVARTKALWLAHRGSYKGSYRGIADQLKEEGIPVKKSLVGEVVTELKPQIRQEYLQYPAVRCPPLPEADRLTVLVSRPPKPEGFEPAPPVLPAGCLTWYGFGLDRLSPPTVELADSLKLPTSEPEPVPPKVGIGFGKRVEWETTFDTDPMVYHRIAKTTTRGPRSKHWSQHKGDKNFLVQLDEAIKNLESDTSSDESTATKRPLPEKKSPAEPAPKKRRTNPRRRARATKKDFEGQL